jgi:hypothetical protein
MVRKRFHNEDNSRAGCPCDPTKSSYACLTWLWHSGRAIDLTLFSSYVMCLSASFKRVGILSYITRKPYRVFDLLFTSVLRMRQGAVQPARPFLSLHCTEILYLESIFVGSGCVLYRMWASKSQSGDAPHSPSPSPPIFRGRHAVHRSCLFCRLKIGNTCDN